MKLKHIALIGSLFPILFSLVLFFGVLISADSDDENSLPSFMIPGQPEYIGRGARCQWHLLSTDRNGV